MPDHRGVRALLGDAQLTLAVFEHLNLAGLVDAVQRAAHAQFALLVEAREVLALVQVAGAGQTGDATLEGIRHCEVGMQRAGHLDRGLATVFRDQLDLEEAAAGKDHHARREGGMQR